MRRSICVVEPNIVLAGEESTWNFTFVTSTNISSGAVLRFDMLSSGLSGDWQLPQTNMRVKTNLIWLTLPSGKELAGKKLEKDDGSIVYDFIIPAQVKQGEKIIFRVGSLGGKRGGNVSQYFVQRRRSFYLYVNNKGKGDFSKDPEIFTVDVKGNKLETIKIIAPSLVAKNKRFDVSIRFEDVYGNLTGNAAEGALIELSYEQLRDNLSWKLFVPETGVLTLPNIYFNECGIYRLKLKDDKNKISATSDPIKCVESDEQLFWGSLRSESKRFNIVEDTESALRFFRDSQTFQFFSTSFDDFNEKEIIDNWKSISSQVAEFNEEERFVTMLGCQWTGEPSEEGVRHFIYAKDNKPFLFQKDQKYNNLKKIYKSHTSKELMSIPCLTMAKGFSYNFDNFNPDFERVVEIYSRFGSTELSAKNGNPMPIKGPARKGVSELEEGSIQKALSKGCRFGFVAGGVSSSGIHKEFSNPSQESYFDGLTAILSKDYSREALFSALYNRKCYATTGARIVASFNIAGQMMGSELSTKSRPGLSFVRYINGFVAGTDDLKSVEIIRNGKVFKSFSGSEKNLSNYFEYEIDDDEKLEKLTHKSPGGEAFPFVYYYLRVIQNDGHMAWSSPIWIDCVPPESKKKSKGPGNGK